MAGRVGVINTDRVRSLLNQGPSQERKAFSSTCFPQPCTTAVSEACSEADKCTRAAVSTDIAEILGMDS